MEILALLLVLLLLPMLAFGGFAWWAVAGRRVVALRLAAALSFLAALTLGGFAWWGTSTVAGRARYDEMDGLYPLGAGLLAILLVLLAVLFGWVAGRRARRLPA